MPQTADDNSRGNEHSGPEPPVTSTSPVAIPSEGKEFGQDNDSINEDLVNIRPSKQTSVLEKLANTLEQEVKDHVKTSKKKEMQSSKSDRGSEPDQEKEKNKRR